METGRAGRSDPARLPALRIVFVVPEDRRTGTYFRFHNLAVALRALGQDVVVFSQTNESHVRTTRQVRDGVPYVLCPTVGGNRLVISPVNPGNIARRLFTSIPRADVYHLFQPYPSGAIPWLALRQRRRGLFAYDWDDYWMNDEFGLKNPRGLNAHVTSLWVRFLESYLPGRCDLLTTLSHNIAGLAHRLRCRRAEIVYNGVWEDTFASRNESRAALDLRTDAFYAAMMGWSGEAEWAIAGLRAWMQRFPRLRVAWCGRDPSAELRPYPDVLDRIDVLGYLSDSELRSFRSAVDLGLIPMADTEFNQFRLPYKLTDFLAAGTPVLASEVGETAIVARQLDGVTCCPPDRASWIEHFGRLVREQNDPNRHHRVDTRNLVRMFSWERIAGKVHAAYRDVLAAKDVAA